MTHLLLVNPLTPQRTHAANAAPVLLYELLCAFVRAGLRTSFLKLDRPGEAAPDDTARASLADLAALGIELPTPVALPKAPPRRRVWQMLFRPRLSDFYPEISGSPAIARAVASCQPDLLLVVWSEWVTAACANLPVRKFAYYGNPDPKAQRLQALLRYRRSGNLLRYAVDRALASRLESVHLEVMARYELLGNVAANDAAYYRECGHPNAFYIQNAWVDRIPEWQARRQAGQRISPFVIIGNVGRVSATANNYGLELMGQALLPELRRAMAGRPFELHLLGAGEPHPTLTRLLAVPEVKWRGFVPDIDAELLSAPVFLCMNNASAYKVGHTRYLHAWSLGSCVVGHVDAALSMPEIRHRVNALLGRSIAQIADLIAEAASDPALRHSLGRAGYATFREHFTGTAVAESIMRHAMLTG